MSDLPSRVELFGVGRAAISGTPASRINPAVVDVPGSDANLIVGAMSLVGEEIVARLAACMRGNFVETARGAQLDRVAFDRYGLTRFPATQATVDLLLQRPTAAFGAFTYPAGSRVQTAAGVQFATNVDVVFGALDLQKTVAATALVAGPGGNVTFSTVVQFADAPADSTLQVTNDDSAAGGADAEEDVDFRGRIRQFFPTVRRGTLGAIEFGALTVPGVAVATVVELLNICNCGSSGAIPGLPISIVQLIVGDRDGGFTSTMLQQVRDTLIDFRACGIPVEVIGGAVVNTPIVWNIEFAAGVDTAAVQSQVLAVTVAASQFLDPGETLFKSSLIAAAKTVPGAVVSDASLQVPAGDIVLTPAQSNIILRVRPQDVTFV